MTGRYRPLIVPDPQPGDPVVCIECTVTVEDVDQHEEFHRKYPA